MRKALDLTYRDGQARATRRRIWPLALYFWGGTWTLGAWCELRGDFRTFRIDRIDDMRDDGMFADQAGRRLADFVRRMEEWM